jgi:hypothetical protein
MSDGISSFRWLSDGVVEIVRILHDRMIPEEHLQVEQWKLSSMLCSIAPYRGSKRLRDADIWL